MLTGNFQLLLVRQKLWHGCQCLHMQKFQNLQYGVEDNPMTLVNYSFNFREPNDYKKVVNLVSSKIFPKQALKGG